MARRKKRAMWTVKELRRRGWTADLIRELLPEPGRVQTTGGETRAWPRDAVLSAERTPAFQSRAESGPAPKTAEGAADALGRSWDGAEKDASIAWRLAGIWHETILDRFRTPSAYRRLRKVQGQGRLDALLALERGAGAERIPEILRQFVQTGWWLEHPHGTRQEERLYERYPYALLGAARAAVESFLASGRTEPALEAMLSAEGLPGGMLLEEGLDRAWSVWYVPRAIRTSLTFLVALDPKDEYPEARAMERHFVLHLGGTNTGKTYAGLQRLMRAPTGIYLAPLRLLALEAQETLLDAGVDCALTTGEEEDRRDDDTHVAATAEKLDLSARYDVAVIDECQMIADKQRGYAWTRAILGVLAPEVHLCAAPEAEGLLLRLIRSCGDTYEVQEHHRQVPLLCMSHTVDLERVQPGDALVTFSKLGVLSVAEDLRQAGKEAAIIYGALPYPARRKQMEGFLEGRMSYVVATDAIGMGLNLPIRRIIFLETEKFDGVERRPLEPSEIQQIAGRAGRYGMYDKGWVGAVRDLGAIRAGLAIKPPPLQKAVAGFSDLVLRAEFDLLEILTEWARMPTVEPYEKLDISRYITVISRMREAGILLTKEEELRAANIPFDEEDPALRDLFFEFLRLYQTGGTPERPALPERDDPPTLPELELHYRKLDLYFSFARTFGYRVDEDALYESRERVAEEINEILLHRLRDNIRFCAKCGRALPLHHRGRICDACYEREHGAAARWRPWRHH